ncbi:hypothetical protein BOTBODRAFT_192299 [Botryobasidium botryosum FD-172 SS1]|uniref:Uncharacterized protein n=1 Tax=Botryobasidium botryosum (strain FD-172 SS1) TaxID=930990 RepID=A0A067M6Q8_BOTB1|nr:hypothetical protein BOTBODRAFT_192299 [Botryobasidium botryosum FD-172 SS1]
MTTESRICPLLRELSISTPEISAENLIELATSRTLFSGTDKNVPPDGTTQLHRLKLAGIWTISILKPDIWEPVNRALSELPLVVDWGVSDWEIDAQVAEEAEGGARQATAGSGA